MRYDFRNEVLRGPSGNGHPVNIVVDAATYFLHALAHRSGRGLHADLMVEPPTLLIESFLCFIKLIEAGTLPLADVPTLRDPFASESIR